MFYLLAVVAMQLSVPLFLAFRRERGLGFRRAINRAAVILFQTWTGAIVLVLGAGLVALIDWLLAEETIIAWSFLYFLFVFVSLAVITGIKAAAADRVPMPSALGSASFASLEHLRDHGHLGETGLRLGFLRIEDRRHVHGLRHPLHYTGQRHLLTVAPTRAGKGVSTIIPNLLTYRGSVLVIDPKGENARLTYDRRSELGRAIALDPWAITGKPGARFNPLDLLAADSPTLIEDAMLIADALVIHEGGENTFWSDEARALIMGFILHVATAPSEEGRRHLGRVRDILTATPDEVNDVGLAMIESDHPVVVSSATRLLGKSPNEYSGVFSTAQQNTHFLESPALRAHLEASDFAFGDLKGTEPVSVYVVLPVDRLSTYGRWLRMLIALGVADIARNPAKPAKPVLFLLDEFAALGRLKVVEDAFGLMAGMGIQLHAIAQDLGQLNRIYGKGWETFVGNAGVIQIFGTRDVFTAEYASKLAGTSTTTTFSSSVGSANSTSYAQAQRPLITPDEIMRMGREMQLLLIENADPIAAEKIVWFEDAALRQYVPAALRDAPL